MSFALRAATEADRELLFHLIRVALGPHIERVFGPWREEEQRARFTALTEPAAHQIVEVDGRSVACLNVRHSPDEVRLNRVFLLPEMQRRGLGTQLVEHVLRSADAAQLPVRLRVLRGNPAQRLYERLGFRCTGETETHVLMERAARAPAASDAEPRAAGDARADDDVRLRRATPEQAPLLENLLELYVHDVSEWFPVVLGPDGRFGYARLPLYWSEPESRHAFLIHHGARVAGFVLATRGSPASDDPSVLDVAEFFVLRAHRRSDVGRRAAFALWDELPGRWVVRVAEANRSGLPFWRAVVPAYTLGRFEETTRPDMPGRRIFSFESRAKRRDDDGSA